MIDVLVMYTGFTKKQCELILDVLISNGMELPMTYKVDRNTDKLIQDRRK